MIVKVMFGSVPQTTHIRIVECDDIHVERKQEEGGTEYTELVCRDTSSVEKWIPKAIVHVGKLCPEGVYDKVFLMQNGVTVDKMTFGSEKQGVKPYEKTAATIARVTINGQEHKIDEGTVLNHAEIAVLAGHKSGDIPTITYQCRPQSKDDRNTSCSGILATGDYILASDGLRITAVYTGNA